MKKVISFVLVLCLVFATSVMVFADDSSDNDPTYETRGSNTQYGYDSKGNRYKVVGQTGKSYYTAWATTSSTRVNYGSGDPANYVGFKLTDSQTALTTFSDGTTSNNYSLDASTDYYAPTDSGNCGASFTFSALVLTVSCTHTFSTTSGAYISFNSVVY